MARATLCSGEGRSSLPLQYRAACGSEVTETRGPAGPHPCARPSGRRETLLGAAKRARPTREPFRRREKLSICPRASRAFGKASQNAEKLSHRRNSSSKRPRASRATGMAMPKNRELLGSRDSFSRHWPRRASNFLNGCPHPARNARHSLRVARASVVATCRMPQSQGKEGSHSPASPDDRGGGGWSEGGAADGAFGGSSFGAAGSRWRPAESSSICFLV